MSELNYLGSGKHPSPLEKKKKKLKINYKEKMVGDPNKPQEGSHKTTFAFLI